MRIEDHIDDLLAETARERVAPSPALYTRIMRDALRIQNMHMANTSSQRRSLWDRLKSNFKLPSLPAMAGSLVAASLCGVLIAFPQQENDLSLTPVEIAYASEIWDSEQEAIEEDLYLWLTGWDETTLLQDI
jgi:hypothetical protein